MRRCGHNRSPLRSSTFSRKLSRGNSSAKDLLHNSNMNSMGTKTTVTTTGGARPLASQRSLYQQDGIQRQNHNDTEPSCDAHWAPAHKALHDV